MTTKKKKKTRKGLPNPASIVEEKVFPAGRILRTTEVDGYEEKKKPAKTKKEKK